MPNLLLQRVESLRAQFTAIPQEMAHWREVSKPGAVFEKHNSQIAVLSAQMLDLNQKVETAWNGALGFPEVQRAQRRCMAVQTVWHYFREKLLLRSDRLLGETLKAADAYTWACYRPVAEARQKANPAGPYREPPLVTFHNEISPSALSRQTRYETDPDPSGVTGEAAFEKVRQALPIPVISIPWQSARVLPNLALLAHETGHIVESDFQLDEAVSKALGNALTGSVLCPAWSGHWQREVFADLFACYAAGPSYVWALIASLPESPETVRDKNGPPSVKIPSGGSIRQEVCA